VIVHIADELPLPHGTNRLMLSSRRMEHLRRLIPLITLFLTISLRAAPMPKGKTHTNSIGMRLARIAAGTFRMGFDGEPLPPEVAEQAWQRNGDWDERPAHDVTIKAPFYMAVFEVTNAQYERFDPDHRKLRGKLGFSTGDDEAVVFVTWHDSNRFCQWLSRKEGLPYRLPTEAEWEYACRAGTRTHFFTGDTLPAIYLKNATRSFYPPPISIDTAVGRTPANAWGLQDMHGNVEEWVCDWYGPYEAGAQADPVGPVDGDFRVTRGGSHSTEVYYLRSENRMGTLPDDAHDLLGFRIVLGQMPKTKPRPVLATRPLNQSAVQQAVPPDLGKGPDPAKPYFRGPREFIKVPPGSFGPMFSTHNHDTALAALSNGDLLAIWYTCVTEPGRELAVLASRLRYGHDEWDDASPFWDAPDRNDHAPALWFDGKGTLYHFSSLSAADTYRHNLALVMRTSRDNGATWSKARLIAPEHAERHMPAQSVFRAQDGAIVLISDTNPGSTTIISRDEGRTWVDPGGKIAGIHAGVVQLKDGRLMAFGRGDNIEGKMPKSISGDMGKTWAYSASEFPPISGGQRLVLTRLREGPLFFASFAPKGGLFGAVSFDEGETWPVKRLITDGQPDHQVERMDGRLFTMGPTNAEPSGYMSVCQTADGVIQLITSREHYAFNLAWLSGNDGVAPSY
jgi:formylglycine-generating enzyme required for sulfatase activity